MGRAYPNPRDTKLFALYFQELWWLSHGIKKKAESIFAETAVPESGYIIQVNPDLHSVITSLLLEASNLKKLISDPTSKRKNESERQHQFRKARVAVLRDTLRGVPLIEMMNSKIRNTLEHFDEYLDEDNIYLADADTPPSPMAAYNMVLSSWNAFNPRVHPIRIYISEERKFYNMKWSVDIGKLHSEALAIIECLANHPLLKNQSDPGGMMLPLL